ncbi:hypothetical protein GQ457_17G026430 [Hibiscus cannabinus]
MKSQRLNSDPLHFAAERKLFTGRPSPCRLLSDISQSYMELGEEARASLAKFYTNPYGNNFELPRYFGTQKSQHAIAVFSFHYKTNYNSCFLKHKLHDSHTLLMRYPIL